MQASAMNALTNRSILMAKANDLANKIREINFTATDGWLTRWKEQISIFNVVYKIKCLENH